MVRLINGLKTSILVMLTGFTVVCMADDRTSTTITATVQPYMSVSAVTPAPRFIVTPTSAKQIQEFDSTWTVSSNASSQQYIVTTTVDNADMQGPYMSLQNPPPGTIDPALTRVHYVIGFAPCGNANSPNWALTNGSNNNSGPATYISNVINGSTGVFSICPGGGSGTLRFILFNMAINPYPLSGSYLGQVTLIATLYS